MPGTIQLSTVTQSLITGEYGYVGRSGFKSFTGPMYVDPESATYFDPQQMAASASY